MRTGIVAAGPGTLRSSTSYTGGGLMSRCPPCGCASRAPAAGVICQYSGIAGEPDLVQHRRDLRVKRHGPIRRFRRCTNACASSAVSKMCGGDAPPRQRLAQLEAHERAGRVARRRRVVVRLHVAHHRGVGVGDRRVDPEVVVVDDQRDLLADRLTALLEHAPHAVDVVARCARAALRD